MSPGPIFYKLLLLKKSVKLKKVSEFVDGSLSPSENRPLGEKALSGQKLEELIFFNGHINTVPRDRKNVKKMS